MLKVFPLVLVLFSLSHSNTYPYSDKYPPFSFKEDSPAHLRAKPLVDWDKLEYKSKDGKIMVRLKEERDSFDFILKDGNLVLAQIKENTPPLPYVVYQADLDNNGLKDFIIFNTYRMNGLGAFMDKVEIFLKKENGAYGKISYDTFCAGLEDFVDLNRDGKYEVIIMGLYGGSKHNYFTYNIYRISHYELVNSDEQFKGFPKFIWFTYKENDKDTTHLTQEERRLHTGKKNTSIQHGEIPALTGKEILEGEFFSDRYILILKSTKDYNEALNFARNAARKLKLEFDNDNRRYSKKKGIYFEGIPDDDYNGGYYPRRYSDEFISLENSDGYKGFKKGYILVVGGIYNDRRASNEALGRVKAVYPDAYVKKTKMWMGCIH
jgi:hypothetical protein